MSQNDSLLKKFPVRAEFYVKQRFKIGPWWSQVDLEDKKWINNIKTQSSYSYLFIEVNFPYLSKIAHSHSGWYFYSNLFSVNTSKFQEKKWSQVHVLKTYVCEIFQLK